MYSCKSFVILTIFCSYDDQLWYFILDSILLQPEMTTFHISKYEQAVHEPIHL